MQLGPLGGLKKFLTPRAGPVFKTPVLTTTFWPSSVDLVAIHAPRRGAGDVLAGEVVDRTVTRALEAAGALAERDVAAEVWTLLGECEEVVLRVDDVHPPGGDVGARLGPESRDGAHRDLGAARAGRQGAQRFVAGVSGRADQQRAAELPTIAEKVASALGGH